MHSAAHHTLQHTDDKSEKYIEPFLVSVEDTVCLLAHDHMVFSGPTPKHLLNKIYFFISPLHASGLPACSGFSLVFISHIFKEE